MPGVVNMPLEELLGWYNTVQQGQSQANSPQNFLWNSFAGFGNGMQNAMSQMYQVNQGNQAAKLYNNNLNAQLGQTGMLSQAQVLQALAQANAAMGVADLQRQGQVDMFNNPLFQDYIRGNTGTAIADAQGKNALAQLQARGAIAKDLFGSLSGMLGNFGIGSGSAGVLQGFSSADGSQSAQLPTAGGGGKPVLYNTNNPAAQPPPTQQDQPGAMQPYLQQISARGGLNANPQPWRQYLADYMAQRRG